MSRHILQVTVTTDSTTDPAAELTAYLDRMGYREVSGVRIESIEQVAQVAEPAAPADETEASILRDIRDLLRSRL